jgi:protoheme IX farnesyltransferase
MNYTASSLQATEDTMTGAAGSAPESRHRPAALPRAASIVEMVPNARAAVFHALPAQVVAFPASGTAALAMPAAQKTRTSVATDIAELFKLRVVALVVVTGWGGYALGMLQSGLAVPQRGLLGTLAGIGLLSAGAGAMNEAVERRTDARMRRTANRPIAAGRMSLAQGLLAGLAAISLGVLWLHLFANPLTEILALLTAFLYTAVYTPLKRKTVWATFIGAFPGAMGPMLGWVAARGRVEVPAAALFAILFVWQFPHFMSIAWLYRHDYARAGIRMLPVLHPDGVSTVVVSLIFAVVMIPISLAPAALGMTGWRYCIPASLLGLLYLAYTVRFARILRPATEEENGTVARALLKASVLYLPLLFTALLFCAYQAR